MTDMRPEHQDLRIFAVPPVRKPDLHAFVGSDTIAGNVAERGLYAEEWFTRLPGEEKAALLELEAGIKTLDPGSAQRCMKFIQIVAALPRSQRAARSEQITARLKTMSPAQRDEYLTSLMAMPAEESYGAVIGAVDAKPIVDLGQWARAGDLDQRKTLETLRLIGGPVFRAFDGETQRKIVAIVRSMANAGRELDDMKARATLLMDTMTMLTPAERERYLNETIAFGRTDGGEIVEDTAVRYERISDLVGPTSIAALRTFPPDIQDRVIMILSRGGQWAPNKEMANELVLALSRLKADHREELVSAMEKEDRREFGAVLAKALDRLGERRGAIRQDRANLTEKLDVLRARDQALDDFEAMTADLRMQKLGESGCHKLFEAVRAGAIVSPQMADAEETAELVNALDGLAAEFDKYKVFVMQHDWASAFAKAEGFDGGEFKLPFDCCAFEFRLSGKRTIALGRALPDMKMEYSHAFLIFVETRAGWALCTSVTIKHSGEWHVAPEISPWGAKIIALVQGQVKAVLVALEAEIAETEVVRAPHKLNAKRERAGKLPIFDHHVVHLANRKRYAPLPAADPDHEKVRKRLHFVRGHWRHYENHKTYISWHLRGDFDLAFIDKEYRL